MSLYNTNINLKTKSGDSIMVLQVPNLDSLSTEEENQSIISPIVITIDKTAISFCFSQTQLANNDSNVRYNIPIRAYNYLVIYTEKRENHFTFGLQVYGNHGEVLLEHNLCYKAMNNSSNILKFQEFLKGLNNSIDRHINIQNKKRIV
ncbi:hypothetical protein COM11_21475 [Bacillus pseudomycoides]|uniref:hypothetical protein n=1 Tax=Bacillus pseudomycoides TaxID=64104 RepID=UPI000BF75B7E|nr:hypothetical protein [Bacillus pseudomycoides]PGC26957.1 hypothetical protein COM11_21475 [Bacillus pseudomycoides]